MTINVITSVRIGHASMQFSDTPAQWEHDADAVFKRQYDWITGTEAGESDNWRTLVAAAKDYGYTIKRYKSNWIAVDRDIIKPLSMKWGATTVVDTKLVAGPGHDSSIIWGTFKHKNPQVGTISVIGSHYATKGAPEAKDPARRVNLWANRKIAKAVSTKAAQLGKGTALSFYGGDQNINDKVSDTFFGGPLTSCWDELKYYPPSLGSRTIDVISSYDHDGRVTCQDAHAYNDKKVFLHTDHYLIDATYSIRLLK